ncbi:hypothetical protein EVAR_36404_1 [Eumeta japonica]|uniref:Uncharacterized protein n=1 Tax=Eumeta variegata TaxID=151549 RepID=A0A4C1VNJ3_EUMVA|nr:hypothetical protein EVAR_36404_1 [Eumeta japonica]
MPYFPAEYKVLGEEISVTSQIITPFEACVRCRVSSSVSTHAPPFANRYSSEYNKSRIDYFGGMVKKYYYAESEYYYGTAFEISLSLKAYALARYRLRVGDDLRHQCNDRIEERRFNALSEAT